MIEFTGEKLEDSTHKLLKKVAKKALKMLGQKPRVLDVCVNFVYDNEMREVNNRMREINEATDVLSFPNLNDVYNKKITKKAFESDISPDTKRIFLGDVVINLDRAKSQAQEYGHSIQRELSYLLVHSILHLLGYDHYDELDKNLMRAQEERVLAEFNLKRA